MLTLTIVLLLLVIRYYFALEKAFVQRKKIIDLIHNSGKPLQETRELYIKLGKVSYTKHCLYVMFFLDPFKLYDSLGLNLRN
jgi:hypothetical protein